MREESGSEEDSDEPVEWEDDDEVSSEEDGSKVVFIPIRLRNQIWDKYHFSGTQLWQRRAGVAPRAANSSCPLVVLASTKQYMPQGQRTLTEVDGDWGGGDRPGKVFYTHAHRKTYRSKLLAVCSWP